MDLAKKEKRIKIIYLLCMIFLGLLISMSFVYCYFRNLDSLSPVYIKDVSIDIVAMIGCGILVFSLANDKPWDSQNRALFRLIFTLCLLFHFDLASSFMEGNPLAANGILMVNSLSFFNQTLLIYCFFVYVREELKIKKSSIYVMRKICQLVVTLDIILILLNVKFGFYFTINGAGDYVGGSYERFSELTTFVIYIIIWIIISRAREHSQRERIILLSFQIFPVMAHLYAQMRDDYSLVLPSYLFSVMLIYINVFATRSRKLLEQKSELDKQRAMLMVSQIQPHFLYNVLTTISNLCVTDPEEAEETTVLFSHYLRTNLDSLRQENPVPFSAELGHIRTYVELEKKRFKDKLNIEIDCPATDFLVPSLGLQPIAENSVKHGIRGKDTPGTLKITSRKVDGGNEVVIEDDGVGFDMNAPMPDDGRSHVGMINVKSRLEQMCGATVTVVSSPGEGCRTTVFFPDAE